MMNALPGTAFQETPQAMHNWKRIKMKPIHRTKANQRHHHLHSNFPTSFNWSRSRVSMMLFVLALVLRFRRLLFGALPLALWVFCFWSFAWSRVFSASSSRIRFSATWRASSCSWRSAITLANIDSTPESSSGDVVSTVTIKLGIMISIDYHHPILLQQWKHETQQENRSFLTIVVMPKCRPSALQEVLTLEPGICTRSCVKRIHNNFCQKCAWQTQWRFPSLPSGTLET